MASTGKSRLSRRAPIGGQLGFARGGSFAFAASGFYDNAGEWMARLSVERVGEARQRGQRDLVAGREPHHLAKHSPYFGDASHSTLAPTARKRLRTSATN